MGLNARAESWAIAGEFRISRGSKSSAEVVVVEITDGETIGRGECVPYGRYGETVDSVITAIESEAESDLRGAAANAIDCARWDLRAKLADKPVHELLSLPNLRPLPIAHTISIGTPDEMHAKAKEIQNPTLLKIKTDGGNDIKRIEAVRNAQPDCDLIVDANEAWNIAQLQEWMPAISDLGVSFIEQPLPADADEALQQIDHKVPLCADESAHNAYSLKLLVGRYDIMNIKLDKTGGLSGALKAIEEAQRLGFKTMIGCMVSTSLSIAPAFLAAQRADYVDLDGGLLLENDRPYALEYSDGLLHPPSPKLWG